MGKTILVVDDDRALALVMQQTLEESGYRVRTAHDGSQALKSVEQEKPDLIILDVQMPEVHGYSFLFRLREIDCSGHIPVIVLTGNRGLEGVFMAEGVKAYLPKPCPPQVVLDKVKELL